MEKEAPISAANSPPRDNALSLEAGNEGGPGHGRGRDFHRSLRFLFFARRSFPIVIRRAALHVTLLNDDVALQFEVVVKTPPPTERLARAADNAMPERARRLPPSGLRAPSLPKATLVLLSPPSTFDLATH